MIAEKFEEQVKKTPCNTAVKTDEESYTYEELNRYANRLAQLILKTLKQTDKVERVSLLFDHGPHMVAAILGVLKAGKAYVPLAAEYPDKRLSYMIKNSESSLILTLSKHEERVSRIVQNSTIQFLSIDRVVENYPKAEENPEIQIPGDHMAYIMYTSGSTGRPRGVVQNQKNVLYYIENWVRIFSITAADRMTLFSSFCHDGSVQDMLAALLNGATLYPLNVRERQGDFDLSEFLIKEGITIWHSVHSLFAYFADSLTGEEDFSALRWILLGGEPIRAHEIKLFKRFFPQSVLANVYGQTESSVNSIWLIHRHDAIEHMTIGDPLDQTQIILLDKDYREVDEFEVGEIIVACPYLSPGYWKDEEASKKTFRSSAELGILYFTGDLGRLLPGGKIEFMGRRDSQVKLRGFRIELGEIESRLLQHPQVHEAVVAAREIKTPGGSESHSADKYLCAYIVAHSADPVGANLVFARDTERELDSPVSPQPFDTAALKAFLAEELPDYMIPTYFVTVDRLPLTQSGKIDRKALPEPQIAASRRYAAPRDQVEEKLVTIWQDVLGLPRDEIGIDADFFEIGGHSLRGTTMLSRVHREFNVSIPVAKIFQLTTVRRLAEYIKLSAKEKYIPIKPGVARKYYPVTSMQKRLFILNEIEGVDTAYNFKSIMRVEGKLDYLRLGNVFKQLLERHESLRTSFELRQDEPVQRIHEAGEIEFRIEYYEADTADRKEVHRSSLIIHRLINQFIRPFDLAHAPLLRVGCIKMMSEAGPCHIVMIDTHHIVFDGTSLMIFWREFMALYSGNELPPVNTQYKDYSEFLNSEWKKKSVKEQEEYWLGEFAGEIPILDLPSDYKRPANQSFAGNFIDFGLEQKETEALRRLALKEGATLYMVLLSMLNVLLAKLSGQEDIIVGTGTAGRNHADIQSTIGLFVNTLALRNFPGAGKGFSTFLREVKDSTLNAYRNQEYQFEELVDKVGVNRDVGRNPLFDVMFVFQNLDVVELEIPGLKLTPYKFERTTTIFDLNLQAYEVEKELKFILGFCTALFKNERIESFVSYFKRILSSLCDNFDKKLSEIEIISPEEKKQILYDFNDTAVDYPRHKTLRQLFADQVEKNPDNIALTAQSKRHPYFEAQHTLSKGEDWFYLSYIELNRIVEYLAGILIVKGLAPGNVVGIIVVPSIEMITGIFAIIEAGGAYLPIDPGYPDERINYMLKDSSTKIVLTSRSFSKKVEKFGSLHVETIFIDEFRGEPCVRHTHKTIVGARRAVPSERSATAADRPNHTIFSPLENLRKKNEIFRHSSTKPETCSLQPENNPSNTAYIIYTSGSTGQPKGVLVEHSSAVNILLSLQDAYPVLPEDRYLLKTSFIFDVSVAEIFGWFFAGGSLVIIGEEKRKDPQQILETVELQKITHINFVPSLFSAFLELLNRQNIHKLNSLRYIFLAGETLSPQLVKKFASLGCKMILQDLYGPTEGTVYASSCSLIGRQEARAVPIGKPLPNIKLYILNKEGHLQPKGVPGELAISGAGVARGYLNNPGLTHERFLNDPFTAGSRLYRTGDLTQWLPDGNIAFFGRLDHQVKIRGFRVELGEIEHRLLEHKDIKEAAVTLKSEKENDDYLCAYIVRAYRPGRSRAESGGFEDQELREYLSRSLPGYMVPSFFVFLEKMPLTPNGKVDRKSLPEPEKSTGLGYRAPRDYIEQKLVEIWAKALGLEKEKIGIDDNFFALGGHSLKGTVVITAVHKAFNVKISLGEIFKIPKISGLSQLIKEAAEDIYIPIKEVEEKDYYELSYAQRRLWVLCQFEENSTAYNMPAVIEFTHVVDKEALRKAITEITRGHESLRTGFKEVADEPVQFIVRQVEEMVIPFREIDLSHLDEQEKEKRWHRVFVTESRSIFDLARVPLFRTLLAKLSEKQYRFIFTIHHIVSDGWSMEIFERELLNLYECFRQGKENGLKPLQFRYRDFSEWHNLQAADLSINGKSHQFWKLKMTGGIPQMLLPRNIDGDSSDIRGALYRFFIPEELSKKLKKLSETGNTTLFMVMFTIYIITLSRYSKGEEIACSFISSGREQESFYPVIGFFVNSLIFKISIDDGSEFTELLHRVHKDALECFKHQNYPLEKVFAELRMRYPDIPVSFNMVNIPGYREFRRIDYVEPYHISDAHDVKFDLEPYIIEYKNGIDTRWAYKKSIFNDRAVEFFVKDYIKLLEFFTANPDRSYRDFKHSGERRKFRRNK